MATRLVDFQADSSSRSVNITSYNLMYIITHHPLHAMTINMLLTGLLAQAVGRAIVVFFTLVINIVTHSYEEFHSKNPVILGSCVEKNRDLYCFFFRKEMKKLLTLIFG